MARILAATLTMWSCLLALPAAKDAAPIVRLDSYEQAVAANPEDLRIAAEYRRVAVASGQYDRTIAFLERLAKRPGSGPNSQINLALALVDKVPSAGEIRRAYIGRDAMNAATRAIARQPSVLAYYIRGRVNLGYDKFIFHRVDKGVADLSKALSLVTPDTPAGLAALVYVALGDGYYKLDDAAKAHEIWSSGAAKFPDNRDLRARLEKSGVPLRDLVHDALSPGRRVNTSLVELFPGP